jgi:hypothetical protein
LIRGGVFVIIEFTKVREAKAELMAERKLREIGKLSEKVEVEAVDAGNRKDAETETLSKQELETGGFASRNGTKR